MLYNFSCFSEEKLKGLRLHLPLLPLGGLLVGIPSRIPANDGEYTFIRLLLVRNAKVRPMKEVSRIEVSNKLKGKNSVKLSLRLDTLCTKATPGLRLNR